MINNDQQLPTMYQEFIAKSRYSRWLATEGRRENWDEVVRRYVNYWENTGKIDKKTAENIFHSIHTLEVMPSMRCLMTAGPALARDNVAGFNCSFLAIDDLRCFDELMYVLMCGTGVGFSVEQEYVDKLPAVAEEMHPTDSVIIVSDSKIGWASAFRELISLLWAGKIPQIDVSRLRPAGAPLKVFGGRASGPEPLVSLFDFTIALTCKARGRRLTALEAHDLVCKIAEVVVVGGVRRSALISLSSLGDQAMQQSKCGAWWEANGQRALANNSAVYKSVPSVEVFLKEWVSLFDSKSGERGIFSRVASKNHAGLNGRRDTNYDFGTNPCSEIILRSKQFCNLTEVVVRSEDSLAKLVDKAVMATILGTLQSSLTDFRYLRAEWKKNTEEEALLGVSLTGIMDHPVLNGSKGTEELKKWLSKLREVCIVTNKEWAEKIGVKQSVAITCVKPSGTVSQLVDSASGIHPRYSNYYIRRVRCDIKDPIAILLRDKGFPCEVDFYNKQSLVFSFPCKAPEGAVTRDDFNCIEQLELWKIYQEYWCEHKPSITVYYKEQEFMLLGDWVYKNFNVLSGVSFLPHTEHTYKQAPYEEISKEKYQELVEQMLGITFSWSDLSGYETSDLTIGAQELACKGGVCEL
jgi:ribonucleoside-triphosphate reductase